MHMVAFIHMSNYYILAALDCMYSIPFMAAQCGQVCWRLESVRVLSDC